MLIGHFLMCLLFSISKVHSEVFTAMADMLHLLGSESMVVDVIDLYVKTEQQRLDKLKQLAKDYEQHNKHALKDGQDYLSNPVNAYKVVKRLTNSWSDVEDLMRSNEAENFIRNISIQRIESHVKFPDSEDLEGAAEALMRIQDVYKLTTRDIASGKIQGSQRAEPLTAQDCYLLGRTAYLKSDWYHTLMWMEEALDTMAKEKDKTADEVEVLEHLAYAMYQQGNIRRALSLTKRLKQLAPDHPRAAGNLKWYQDELSQGGLKDSGSMPPVVNERGNDQSVPERTQYERLCRGETHIHPNRERKLKCYLKTDRPFLKIAPIKVEVLHLEPKVVVLRQVVSDGEIEAIKKMAYPKLRRATVHNKDTGKLEHASYRISKSAWLEDHDDPIVKRISQRMDLMTNLDMKTAELFQIANYGIGGHYDPHFDHSTDDEIDAFGPRLGNRIATVLFYLSDVDSGGATVFPKLNLALFPTKNDAAFWHNLKHNGRGDDLTRHAGCPVLAGVKWVSNKWIHERGQEFRRPCKLEEDYYE